MPEHRHSDATLTWCGSEWYSLGDGCFGWARGYAGLESGSCLEDREIVEHLKTHQSQLERHVSRLNGCFAAVLTRPAEAPVLVTDRYGTIPIFVTRREGAIYAADDPWSILGQLDSAPELDVVAAVDLLRTGYVVGTRTLLSQIETIAHATVAFVEEDARLQPRRYWRYGYRPAPVTADAAEKQLHEILVRVAGRTARYVQSRGYRLGLTLSGGLDSRVLAALLSGTSPEDVTALSYGIPGDPEIDVAYQVAQTLGLRFRASQITTDALRPPALARSVRAVGLTTRFTCGVGVRALDTSDVDALVPGHTGDFVTGGHLPLQVGLVGNRSQLRRYLAFAHFTYLGSEAVLRDVLRLDYDSIKWTSLEASTSDFDFAEDIFGLIDRWNVENRQRRLILTELRSYERAGRWALPFYDHELIDFYATVPHQLRLGQNLYITTAKRRIFRGRAAPLASVRRVGGHSMQPDLTLGVRVSRLRRLQPVSGWFLEFCLPRLRDTARTLRPRPEQRFGADPVKAWFQSDEDLRHCLLERVASVELEMIDTDRLAARLRDTRSEERVYHRLLTGVLTVDECLKQARRTWERSRSSRQAPGAA